MKNIFTLILISLISMSAFGQLNFHWEEDSIDFDRDFEADLFDLASEGFDTDNDGVNDSTAYYVVNHILNESAETEFHWQFTTLAPNEWVIQVCDEELCYPAWTTDEDVTIANNYNYEFHYLIRPNGTSGSAIINMDLWPLSDSTDVRSTYWSIVGNVMTGTGENELKLIEIDIYPNPSSDAINIVTGSNPLLVSSSIFNQTGQIVMKSDVTEGRLDISALDAGNYILMLNNAAGEPVATKNFIKR